MNELSVGMHQPATAPHEVRKAATLRELNRHLLIPQPGGLLSTSTLLPPATRIPIRPRDDPNGLKGRQDSVVTPSSAAQPAGGALSRIPVRAGAADRYTPADPRVPSRHAPPPSSLFVHDAPPSSALGRDPAVVQAEPLLRACCVRWRTIVVNARQARWAAQHRSRGLLQRAFNALRTHAQQTWRHGLRSVYHDRLSLLRRTLTRWRHALGAHRTDEKNASRARRHAQMTISRRVLRAWEDYILYRQEKKLRNATALMIWNRNMVSRTFCTWIMRLRTVAQLASTAKQAQRALALSQKRRTLSHWHAVWRSVCQRRQRAREAASFARLRALAGRVVPSPCPLHC